MKKICRICVCLVLGLSLVIGVVSLIKKEDYSYYLVMGDYVSKNQIINDKEISSFSYLVGEYLKQEEVVNEVNDVYLKNNMTSKKLLEMIEKDSYIEDSSLVSLIKKSKYITITLGINDVLNQIKYDSNKNKLIYDKDIITNKIEIFKHNYHEIIQEIKNINNNVNVLLVGCYVVYQDDKLSKNINDAIKEVASENSAYFIDISDIEDKYMYQENELYLTNLGQEVISSKVISVIKEIEVI